MALTPEERERVAKRPRLPMAKRFLGGELVPANATVKQMAGRGVSAILSATTLCLSQTPASAAPPAPSGAISLTPATAKTLPPYLQGLLMYVKFNRELLSNDELVRLLSVVSTSSEANCSAAVVYRNEFDAAGATVRARAALNRLLDAMPAQIVGLLDFDLGTYDRSVGGFPLGSLHGDGRLYPQPANRTAMGVFSEPPENVGNNLRWCGLDPFPRLRVQMRFIAPDVEWWGYLKMDETAARAFVAAHPGARKITVRFNDVVTGTRQLANGWRPDPAYIFELVGSIRNITVSDWASHRPLPGTIVFR